MSTPITELKIRTIGDPALRRNAREVKQITPRHKEILSKMARLMYERKGIGLAAPQLGINECLIIVDVGSGLYKLINPKIIKKEGCRVMEEGCLSVPDTYIKVKRAKKILIKAKDIDCNSITVEADELLACVIQHEIDHLKGKLIVDYASFLDKLKLLGKKSLINKKNARLSKPKI
ncbi:MAG: peptide deformylase [Candidatus Omnitrophota bacterium]|nr:peptide deformylase [Candidatus Omnitrophota bacterium]